MLQYPVQLPLQDHNQPFSQFQFKDFRRPNDFQSINPPKSASNRFPSSRNPLFAPSPIDISPNLPSDSSLSSASPSTPSVKLPLPRSPYISSRQILAPHPTGTGTAAPLAERPASRPSSVVSSTVEDVLFPGDLVGEDVLLQGEPIRLVSIGSTLYPRAADYEEPAKEFEVVRRLGTGSYAVVYLVREVLSRLPPSDDGHGHMPILGSIELDGPVRCPSTEYGREFAIKCLSKANLDDDALAAQMSEVTIHQSLQAHPNIVTLYRTLETSSFLLLVLEFVPGEDLFYFLEQARDHFESEYPTDPSESPSRTPPTPSLLSTLDPAQLLSRTRLRLISSMFSQMCDAVAACHAQQVFHRDIKPENFIVTDGYTTLSNGRLERKVVVKLTDFGLSTTDLESSDMDCGSAPYMSYECRNNVAPTYRPRAADVWSLGIVLINMLYHFNPWTDTSEDACNSFSSFRQQPIYFFMSRFVGMTRPVAEFLATRVFCILEDPSDDSRRISASEFGLWARDLPSLLGVPGSAAHSRNGSLTGAHPLSSATQISHRPCSRPPSRCTPSMAIRTPAGGQVRSLSRAPSLVPALEREEVVAAELSTVMDDENEEHVQEVEVGVDADQSLTTAASGTTDDASVAGTESRSTSTNKRRKRGARKGKGLAQTPTTPQDATLATLAVASQSLARELSQASKNGSVKSGTGSVSSKAGSTSSRRTVFEPVAMYAVPTPLLSLPVPPVPLLPPTKTSTGTNTPQGPVKKPSKWKLSFGKASAPVLPANGLPFGDDAASVLSSLPPSAPSDSVLSLGSQSTSSKHSRGSRGSESAPSATASNVANLLMGLNAPVPTASSAYSIKSSDDATSTWSRGRRARISPAASSLNVNLTSLGSSNHGGSRSRGPPGLSTSPHRERERRNERAISPNSTRSGRPLASSASSMTSSNWRNSMSTTSSAGTSTSAFTRYSNSSMGSVSTAATSVSSTSWRTGGVKSNPSSPNLPGYRPPTLPKNIKYMDGVPWELNELPRGLHPNPVGDIFGSPPVRKQRTRKPKDLKLDTINERVPAQKSPEYPRRDASTSTTDLGSTLNIKDESDGPKKVQKGQINALAKMLSALRR